MNTCLHCGALARHIRHEKVVGIQAKTFRFHYFAAQANPRGYPCPEKTRGGPDELLYHSAGIDAIDVTIVKQSSLDKQDRMQAAYSRKVRNYSNFIQSTTFTCVPFVMSHLGAIHPQTLERMRFWAADAGNHQLFFDLCHNSQMEVIRGTYQGHQSLHARISVAEGELLLLDDYLDPSSQPDVEAGILDSDVCTDVCVNVRGVTAPTNLGKHGTEAPKKSRTEYGALFLKDAGGKKHTHSPISWSRR